MSVCSCGRATMCSIRELAAKYATVKRFLPTLLRVIQFDGNAAAHVLCWRRCNGCRSGPIMTRQSQSSTRRGSATFFGRTAKSMCGPSLSVRSICCAWPSGAAMSSSSRVGGMPIRKLDF